MPDAVHQGAALDLFEISGVQEDRVYTPEWCALDMILHFSPSGRILEPCCGGGAFLRHLPDTALWCEIDKGRDFFDWSDRVDWIITNPPFTLTRPFLRHAMRWSDNVVFLVPPRNIYAGYGCIREGHIYGDMVEMRHYGRGSKLGFPFGNAVSAIHWRRGYRGPTIQSFYEDDRLKEG